MDSFVSRLLNRTWAQILLAFLIGVALSFVPDKGNYMAFHHIGIGLLVAAVVTLFWHMREFSEFFEKFARKVLIDDEYLSRLSIETLTQIRSKAGREILKSKVKNDDYERDQLSDWIDEILYERLLPSEKGASGIYRENYNERIYVEHRSLGDALAEVGAPDSGVPQEALTAIIQKITTISWYRVIAPQKSECPPYMVHMEGRFADLPYFPLKSRVAFFAGHGEAFAEVVPVEITDRKLGGIDFKSSPLGLRIAEGECSVWTKSVEYRSPGAEAHILNTMNILTRGLEVDLTQTGPGPRLVIDAGLIAIGTGEDSVTPFPFGIHLKYNGWLFQDHGYCIWWWQSAAPRL